MSQSLKTDHHLLFGSFSNSGQVILSKTNHMQRVHETDCLRGKATQLHYFNTWKLHNKLQYAECMKSAEDCAALHSRLYFDLTLNTATQFTVYIIWECWLDRQTRVIMSVWGSGLTMAKLWLASGNSWLNIGKTLKTKYWLKVHGSYDWQALGNCHFSPLPQSI